jgi:hypothetical protein
MYNPYFTQMLNPAYLDILDCPYLNYAKSPTDVNNTPDISSPCTVPEQNVSGFIDSLKYDWESLPDDIKTEYYNKLNQLLDEVNKKPSIEKFTEKMETTYPIILSISIIVLIVLVVAGIYVFSRK